MYTQLFKYVFNPFFEKVIKRRKMLDYRAFLEESQWWPCEKLLEFQWNELKKLLKHCYEQVPYWQEKFKQLGMTPEDIQTYEDFRRLPVTTKQDIRANKDKMIAENYRGKLWTKLTSGSTGFPLVLDYTPESFDWRVAAWKRGYSWAGCEDGMRQLWFWGGMLTPKSALRRFKENLHYSLMRKKYFVCNSMDDKGKAEFVRTFNRFRPGIVIAYANPLFAVAQYILQNGGLRVSPKAVITGAEKLYEVQRRVIQQAFSCKVFNTYGYREVMLIGAECREHRGLHLNVENVLVEILRGDGTMAVPGEQGGVVVTDLHNYGMPLIRYANEDAGILSAKASCPCGRGLPLLEDIIGRSLDIIQTPEGKDISGEFFAIVMLDKMGVDRYRVTQERLDYLLVEMVRNPKFTENEFQTIKEQIAPVVGPSVQVEYRWVGELPVTGTGKFRLTVSKIRGQSA